MATVVAICDCVVAVAGEPVKVRVGERRDDTDAVVLVSSNLWVADGASEDVLARAVVARKALWP